MLLNCFFFISIISSNNDCKFKTILLCVCSTEFNLNHSDIAILLYWFKYKHPVSYHILYYTYLLLKKISNEFQVIELILKNKTNIKINYITYSNVLYTNIIKFNHLQFLHHSFRYNDHRIVQNTTCYVL